ncbi:hypothetical protein EZS27_042261, partial [termite gut metagenome]
HRAFVKSKKLSKELYQLYHEKELYQSDLFAIGFGNSQCTGKLYAIERIL